MKSIMSQFHANYEEIAGFANFIREEFGLSIVLINLRPFNTLTIEKELTSDDLKSAGHIRMFFSSEKFNLNVSSQSEFLDLNKGCINIYRAIDARRFARIKY